MTENKTQDCEHFKTLILNNVFFFIGGGGQCFKNAFYLYERLESKMSFDASSYFPYHVFVFPSTSDCFGHLDIKHN